MKCPVCNQETSGRFCESCGFELHVLPEGVGEEVKKYESERVERHQKAFEGLQKLQVFERKTKELEEQLSESQKAVNEGRSEISKQQAELEHQKAELEQRIAEIDQQKKRLEQQATELQTVQMSLADLQTKNGQFESNLRESQAEVKSLRTQLEQAENARANAQLDGVVRVVKKDSSGGVVAERFLPVYKGLNIYGTKPSNRSDCQVHTVGIPRTPIKDEHFTVERNGSGQMVLRPINGDLTCDGRQIPPTGQAVEIHHLISIGNTIEIRVSKI